MLFGLLPEFYYFFFSLTERLQLAREAIASAPLPLLGIVSRRRYYADERRFVCVYKICPETSWANTAFRRTGRRI